MGNKDNMRQAMKELLGLVGIGDEKVAEADMVGNTVPKAEPVKIEREVIRAEAPTASPKPAAEARPFVSAFLNRTVEESVEEPSVADDPFFQQPVYAPAPPVADTIISAGTNLFGDLRADGDVEIRGTLKGNLQATGRVRILGKVLGDIKGSAVELVNCAVQGNITAVELVSLDQGTVLIGDVMANDLRTDGKMKGNAMLDRTATFNSNALLAGNVTATLVSMSEGAKIQGTVRISQDEKTDALFDAALNI